MRRKLRRMIKFLTDSLELIRMALTPSEYSVLSWLFDTNRSAGRTFKELSVYLSDERASVGKTATKSGEEELDHKPQSQGKSSQRHRKDPDKDQGSRMDRYLRSVATTILTESNIGVPDCSVNVYAENISLPASQIPVLGSIVERCVTNLLEEPVRQGKTPLEIRLALGAAGGQATLTFQSTERDSDTCSGLTRGGPLKEVRRLVEDSLQGTFLLRLNDTHVSMVANFPIENE